MSQLRPVWWQKYGTVGQIAQFLCEKTVNEPVYLTTYSSETQHWIAAEMKKSGVTAPDCKLRKT
jgi:hypothetical protein